MTENKATRTEGVLKALRTYRTEQGLSAPFPTLSAALFDMDGVLFDSMPAHCRSWVQAAHEVGLQMNEEDVYWFEARRVATRSSYSTSVLSAATPPPRRRSGYMSARHSSSTSTIRARHSLVSSWYSPSSPTWSASSSQALRKPRSWGGWMKPSPRSSPKILWSQARTCAVASLTPSPT